MVSLNPVVREGAARSYPLKKKNQIVTVAYGRRNDNQAGAHESGTALSAARLGDLIVVPGTGSAELAINVCLRNS